MKNKANYFKESDPSKEQELLSARLSDKVGVAVRTHTPTFSAFINPFDAHKALSLLNTREVSAHIFGGYEGAERVMLGFFPEYCEISEDEFPITALEISYNAKFSSPIEHRQYLGSILGLGITRDKVGDIIPLEGRGIALVSSDIASFILEGLTRVGRTAVKVKEISSFTPPSSNGHSVRMTIASLRVDVLISSVFRISRSKASELIKSEKVFINWQSVRSVSATVKEGDVITLRGSGRAVLDSIEGTTKKDRIALNVTIFGR